MLDTVMKIGSVDLTKGVTKVENVAVSRQNRLMAGAGVFSCGEGYRLPISDLAGPEVQNLVLISTGPLTGSGVPGSGTWSVTYFSPLQGCFVTEQAGGRLGANLRYAGLDQLIIWGKAPKPVYLKINDGEIHIGDASFLWELGTGETTETLLAEDDDSGQDVAVIGPGDVFWPGQGLMVNYYGEVGEWGLGTTFARILLKGITVKGTGQVKLAYPELFLQHCLEVCQVYGNGLGVSGSGGFLSPLPGASVVPVPGEDNKLVLEPSFAGGIHSQNGQMWEEQLLRLKYFGNYFGIPWKRVEEALLSGAHLIDWEKQVNTDDFWRLLAHRKVPLWPEHDACSREPVWTAIEAAGLDWHGCFTGKEAAKNAARLLFLAIGCQWHSWELEELGIKVKAAKGISCEREGEKWL